MEVDVTITTRVAVVVVLVVEVPNTVCVVLLVTVVVDVGRFRQEHPVESAAFANLASGPGRLLLAFEPG